MLEKVITEQLDFRDRKSLAVLEAELERRKSYVWKTKSGDLIKVKDMTNEHLENAIKNLRKHWKTIDYLRENIKVCMDPRTIMIKENKMKDKNLLAWDEILKPGTPFWSIGFYPEEKQIKCSVCKGKGEIKLEGKKYECPECYGKGYNVERKPAEWHIDKKWCADFWVVTRTEINQTDKSDLYRVMYWDECNGFPAEKVFTSRAKATREVNKLNKAIQEEKMTLNL